MPGLVALTGFHRRNDVHQTRMIAAPLKHLGDHIFLADVGFGDMLDLDPRRLRQLLRALAERLAQGLGKPGIVENPNAPRVQKTPSCPAHSRPPATCPSSRCGRNRRAPHATDLRTVPPTPVSSSPPPLSPCVQYLFLFGSGYAGLGVLRLLNRFALPAPISRSRSCPSTVVHCTFCHPVTVLLRSTRIASNKTCLRNEPLQISDLPRAVLTILPIAQ